VTLKRESPPNKSFGGWDEMEVLGVAALIIEIAGIVAGAVWIVAGIKSTTKVFEASLSNLSLSVGNLALKVENLDTSLNTSKKDIAILASKLDSMQSILKIHVSREDKCVENVNRLIAALSQLEQKLEDHLNAK
jgi:outer membrane murein-binding lipoprotein Lpp